MRSRTLTIHSRKIASRCIGGIDGLALAETVRTRWPQIRFLLTSDHMLPTTVPVPDGAIFLPKPYNLIEVRALLAA